MLSCCSGACAPQGFSLRLTRGIGAAVHLHFRRHPSFHRTRGSGAAVHIARQPSAMVKKETKKDGNHPQWAPVQIQQGLTIKGGLMRKAQVVPTKLFDYEGRQVTMVAISKSELWLSPIVAGTCASTRPLSRCQIFKRIWDLLGGGPLQPTHALQADKMADLNFEDDVADADGSPSSPVSQKHKRSKVPNKLREAVVDRVGVPASASAAAVLGPAGAGGAAAADLRHVIAARDKTKLYLEVDALSWLVQFVREEIVTGGVAAVVDEPVPDAASSGPNIFWDFHNDCWAARTKGSSCKDAVRTRSFVKCRMKPGKDLENCTFAEAKQRVYEELAANIADGLPLEDAGAIDGDA